MKGPRDGLRSSLARGSTRHHRSSEGYEHQAFALLLEPCGIRRVQICPPLLRPPLDSSTTTSPQHPIIQQVNILPKTEALTWGAGVYLYVCVCLGKLGERGVSSKERLTGRVANHLGLNEAQTTQHTGGRESGRVHTRGTQCHPHKRTFCSE